MCFGQVARPERDRVEATTKAVRARAKAAEAEAEAAAAVLEALADCGSSQGGAKKDDPPEVPKNWWVPGKELVGGGQGDPFAGGSGESKAVHENGAALADPEVKGLSSPLTAAASHASGGDAKAKNQADVGVLGRRMAPIAESASLELRRLEAAPQNSTAAAPPPTVANGTAREGAGAATGRAALESRLERHFGDPIHGDVCRWFVRKGNTSQKVETGDYTCPRACVKVPSFCFKQLEAASQLLLVPPQYHYARKPFVFLACLGVCLAVGLVQGCDCSLVRGRE